MLLRPLRPRDLAVGDVADERVGEGVLGVSFHRGPALALHELLALEALEQLFDARRFDALAELTKRSEPEDLADDGCVLNECLFLVAEGVEPG